MSRFRNEKTLKKGASGLVYQWQYVADKIHDGLFIRVILSPLTRKVENDQISLIFIIYAETKNSHIYNVR